MSSLFDKFKALVNARLFGPRPALREQRPSAESLQEPPSPRDITEASSDRHRVPEVTEAIVDTEPEHATSSVAARSELQEEQPQEDRTASDDLEDERIVDLLKDEKA